MQATTFKNNTYKKKLLSYFPNTKNNQSLRILKDCEFVFIKRKGFAIAPEYKISGSIGAIAFYLGDIISKLYPDQSERDTFFLLLQNESDKIANLHKSFSALKDKAQDF